jgi:hypothetical protein
MMNQSGKTKGSFSLRRPLQSLHSMRTSNQEKPNQEKKTLSQKVGQTTGKVLDTKNRVRANINHRKQQVKDLPITAKYVASRGKERLQQPSKDFKKGITQAKEQRQRENTERTSKHQQTIAEKRQALDKKQKNTTAYSKKPTVQKKSPSSLIKEKQKLKPKERLVPESRQRKPVPMPKEEKQVLRTKEKANQPYKESIDRKKPYRKANPVRLPKQTPKAKKQQVIQRPALPRKQTRKQPKPPRQRQTVRRKRP